jgi:hypothetical protein
MVTVTVNMLPVPENFTGGGALSVVSESTVAYRGSSSFKSNVTPFDRDTY